MRAVFLATTCLIAVSLQPAAAQRGGFGAGLVGGVIGGVIGGALVQPRAPVYVAPPPPVYVVPPPVVYERRVYAPPVYVPPAVRVASHPWPGPGFACYDPEPNSVNRAICGSEDLSAAQLSVQQAFYAAIQQTPYNAGALRAEYTNFLQSERASCAPYGFQQQTDCIAGMLSHEHDVVTGRLSGVFADEAARPVAVHVEVQQRLRAMGLLSGTADGVYGEGTRRAIAAWQAGHGRSATGVLSNEDVAMLIPGYGGPSFSASAPMPVVAPPATVQQAPPAPVQQAPVVQASAPAPLVVPVPAAAPDLLGGLHEGMPYALARPKLFAAGWQTQYFSSADLSDQDRDARQWFIDHRIAEVQDCSSSGCKLQFHNGDGRLLYVYTQVGSRTSDAYRGAGPSVIAYCIDVDDITCSAPQGAPAVTAQQATR